MFTSYWKMLRLFSRDVRLFFISAVLIGFAWDGVRAVLYNLYLLRLGYGPETVGVINAVGALAFSLMCLPAGAMGTRWSSRSMLIAGAGLVAAGLCLLPLAGSFAGPWRTGWLLVTLVVSFLGYALYLVNGLPFMMGATGVAERNHAFSVHIAVVPLAAFVGSLVAGATPGILAEVLGLSLEEDAPYGLPMLLAALSLIPAALALMRTQPVDSQQVQSSAPSDPAERKDRPPYGLLIAVGLIMALRFGGRGTVATFFNIYLDDGLSVSTSLIGALSSAGQLLSVPAALVAPLVVARWGDARTIFWGMLTMALCVLPLALVPHWAAAGLGFVSSSAFFSVTIGPMRLFSQELVTPRWRAAIASTFMLGAGLAFSAMSLVGGYAIVALGYRTLFLVGAGLASASALLFWSIFRLPRGEIARHPSVR